ncbi:MAG: mannose-1-phosphate guanylyltransferase [Phycisphaerae bacterium]|nr:mannose-1-phosphate guanylyltransferase [Phycisphaerae bacterium]
MRYAMIMAGGAGTRLWPMSRKNRPKQLLPFIHDPRPGAPPASLLALAAARLEGVVPPERRFICTGESYRDAIRAALPEFSDARILGEPVARDTVNAVGFAAAVFEKLDPGAIFAVFTADHVIAPLDVFRQRVDLGFRLVEADPRRLVTFSIEPTYPATGYGYVERGTPVLGLSGSENLAYRVARFVEKPNAQRAQAYFESGLFGWNSGMFVWKAATVLDCLRRFKPECHAGLMEIQRAWGTPAQAETLGRVYPTLPRTSIDYAVMEPAGADKQVQVCTVRMDVEWLDVGSWPSYGETLPADADGNRLGGVGRAVTMGTRGSLVAVDNPGHTVALLGVENLIVIHTPDATLIMPREKAESLKALHDALDERLK